MLLSEERIDGIVEAILDDLLIRKGFDELWERIITEVRHEIKAEMKEVIMRYLSTPISKLLIKE